jgi:hypothetical protein
VLVFLLSCAPYPEGLRATPAGDGPVVRVDWEAKPLPDIPFPNDLATRTDPASPTGLRLNVPVAATTKMEREAREKLNMLSGFGIYAPITAAFDAPLDLANIRARHTDDQKLGVEAFSDDAVFLIDVDPDSPDFGKPVALDLGSGRYPMDVPNPDRYFPNDSRGTCPSLVFECVEEDLNGNGVLDPGEDTDNDGVLDHPNVYPEGGDPRADLLTFYEKSTDTLILRPVRPLREKTTYAVVFTERLTGVDGNPVRSPWEWVNHLRQTDALSPLVDALPGLKLGIDDVAFAWAFTTGDVTGDLRAARRGLLGEGPLAAMDAHFPEGVTEAGVVTDLDGVPPERLPVENLVAALTDLGLFDEVSAGPLIDNYGTFAEAVVGGAFTTPNLLGESMGENLAWPAADDSDDYWQIDGANGLYSARPERVPFTCVTPKGVPQPAPVVVFGHGYGSSRFDFLGFAWAFNRMGYAACAFDYPGHGPTLSADEEALVEAALSTRGLLPFYEHLKDSRYRDLDNDGKGDSGGDQWTADAFHTRDMVRQAALDHAQFIDSIRACGEGTMRLPDGSSRPSCDWDGDGTPDIGGPGGPISQIGGSLGGINTAVTAAVVDGVDAWAAVVPGGGLLDVAFRTEIGGAVEAMHGRLMSPLFLGYPTESGGLEIRQMVNSVKDMVELHVATLPTIPAGGTVVVENLVTGVERTGMIPADGGFRVGIAADAASAWEKARIAEIPEVGPTPGAVYVIEEPTEAGDAIRVSVKDAAGAQVAVIDAWEEDVSIQGVVYPAGSSLVAAAEGLGYIRGSSDLRRVAFVFGAILEAGDPIAYARAYDAEPFDDLAGEPRNILLMPTPGDTIVSINTGIALARAAGWIDDSTVDTRYGTTVDRWLIDKGVVQGLEEFGGQSCSDGSPCLFDVDDLDNGTDGTGAPSEAPLRITLDNGRGTSALRLPYVRTTGTHGFATPEPDRPFDVPTFAGMQMASYFASRGLELSDDPCLEDASCAWIPAIPGGGDDTGDTGTGDTGTGDTGTGDTGTGDTGTDDTGTDDTGDSGTSDSGGSDSGGSDSGDSGSTP